MVAAKNKILIILMNGLLVGKLEKSISGLLYFSYDQTWLERQNARPISLSLPLTAQIYSGDVVFNFFDNLLPDNPTIRSQIQAQFQIPSQQAFDLLSCIGKDCVGAIQIIYQDEKNSAKNNMLSKPLTEKQIATMLKNSHDFPFGMSEKDDFRISIAGAQEKFGFLYWQKRWRKPIGATPTTHIFKLPIGLIAHQHMDLHDSCENEWLCAQIADAFGLPVASSEIQYFENIKALVVKRFDRKPSSDQQKILRLPQEDMCQALGVSSHLKYQSDGGPGIKEIMRLLLGSASPAEDRDAFFSAQVLFWLLAAIDGHAKNFSIQIEAGGQYRLAPLYDIISAFPMIKNKSLQAQKIKMAMALKSKSNHYHWDIMQRRYFLSTAKAANYSVQHAETILESMLSRVDSVIDAVSQKLPKDFPSKIADPVFNGMLLSKKKLQD